ncbi:hypothetical protein [Salinibaculum rarum]|uniref:hypothetical protein n=1 Tax=Salinibaculum rarum TaxID=3058903 RepID=UPI00265E2E35|nr:hypothetical protein [Salinibaculum sp. KK48]
MANTTDTTEVPPPDFIGPAIRCALEMLLVGALVLVVGLPTTNAFYLGLVIVLAVVAMVTVLFWSLNQQMEAWIARARRTGSRSNN